jgi:hypothetical protein
VTNRIWLPTAGVVALTLLAGCGAPMPAPSPTATASPTSEVAPLVVPRPALDLACAEAVRPDSLGDLFADQSPVTGDNGLSAVSSFYEVYELQESVLSCDWEAGDFYAGFSVMPDASAAYADRVTDYGIPGDDYIRHDQFGDDSRHFCAYGYCRADVLVGELWVGVSAGRPDLTDELDLEPLFLPLTADVIASVRTAADAGLRERWDVPNGAYRAPPGFCDDEMVDRLGDALGLPLYATGTDGWGGFTHELWVRSGLFQCGMTWLDAPGTYIHLEVIPGALWALESFAGIESPRHGQYEYVDIDGDQALIAANSRGADAIVPVDGSLLNVSYDGLSQTELAALLPTIVGVMLDNAVD